MVDFINVTGSGPSIGIVQCSDCKAAWKQTEEFITACPKCQSSALEEYEAVASPAEPASYIVVQPPEAHEI